jgi:hypothetical protein
MIIALKKIRLAGGSGKVASIKPRSSSASTMKGVNRIIENVAEWKITR